jgi:hypothetical protein
MQVSLEALETDRFLVLCSTTMDNSCQLGTLALHNLTANTSFINQQNFLTEGKGLIFHINKSRTTTSMAFRQ